ncbi:hypothetical protein F511_09648 [Dorcoceras hygrometricum]|uniref:CCHC-type domain-containing protein n=1 Tax=Dorcoceras hygrometricum TaxID=472368 RepID=A0A2Z7DEM3_9LAMI|nr:hypothetical protein F511_09648 [Dorcoceras hygrometricum]
MNGAAISNIHLAVADRVLSSIAEIKLTKVVWDTLTKMYEVKSLHNKIFLKRKLYTLRMAESSSMTDHINTLNTLFAQLTSMEHIIEEKERAELLLQSLKDSYDQLIINITNNVLTDVLNFNDVLNAVLSEESRRKNKEDRLASSKQAEALPMIRGRSTEHDFSGSYRNGRSKFRSKKKNICCYKCGSKGHFKKECTRSIEKSFQGNVASNSDGAEIFFSEATTVAEGIHKFCDAWIMDSGATWHMTSRREWFDQYEPVSGGSVFIGNDHALEIAGVGTIKIKMFDGTICTIQEVRHVKGLTKNLLSLGQLDDVGCKTRIESEILKIVKGALVVMKAENVATNLYVILGANTQRSGTSCCIKWFGRRIIGVMA